MNILIDFCNIHSFSYRTVAGLYKRHGIIHAPRDGEQEDSFAKTRLLEERYFLGRSPQVLLPLFMALSKSQSEYRAFLDECIRGNLDLNFVNSRVTLLSEGKRGYEIKFDPGSTTWTPRFILFPTVISSLEEYVDIYGIMFPLFRGEGDMFSLTRKCKHCGNYFFAKTKRAEFCSDPCRKDHFRLVKVA